MKLLGLILLYFIIVYGVSSLTGQQTQEYDDLTKKLYKYSNYSQMIQEISALINQVQQSNYLERDYCYELKSVLQKICEMRDADKQEYEEIQALERKQQFENMVPKIVKYIRNESHLRIMRDDLVNYYQSFSAGIEVRMDVFANVDDTGGGEPDIRLTITKICYERSQNNKEKGFTESFQEDDKKIWPAKYFTINMCLTKLYYLNIAVVEIDPWSSDDEYGSFNFFIQELLNKKSVSYTHSCGSDGSDGYVKIELTPQAIRKNRTLPAFNE